MQLLAALILAVGFLLFVGSFVPETGIYAIAEGLGMSPVDLGSTLMMWGIGLVVVGGLFVGAIDRSRRGKVEYFCSKCDQYLGTGNGYQRTCQRCGSNRVVWRKNT